ncbi:MAG: rod shape-determining protein MreC [Planctomycetota bacterium]
MRHHDRIDLRSLLSSPTASLALGLALAVGLMLVPARWSEVAKGGAAALLRPGQVGVLSLRENGSELVGRVKSHFGTAAQLAEAKRERKRLAEENRRLAAELAAERSRRSNRAENPDRDSPEQLLGAQCVEARVLGQLARAFLDRRHLLDIGSEAGIQPDAPVLHVSPRMIDQGGDAGLQAGHLVLSSGRVWGKIIEVGRHTSVVRTVTQPGYRDLVELGTSGPQGILEGTGEPLAQIRLVEVTEPVSVGDPVYSTAGKGFLPEPLLSGWVVALERPVGAAHWDIRVEPAVDPDKTDHVAVLRIELNPSRVASRQRAAGSGQ